MLLFYGIVIEAGGKLRYIHTKMLRRLFNRLNVFFMMQGRGGIAAFVLLFLSVIGWFDHQVGYEISLTFFYLIPLGLSVWYLGIRIGLWTALVCVLVWDGTNRAAGQEFSNELIRYWNMGIRLASYGVVALLLHELKSAIWVERSLARTDPLTGIFNRREFNEQLEFELKRADRLMYPVTLAYIDLDNFKLVNDAHGHKVGDEQLRLIAQTISGIIRKTDLFARLGGDEFGLFLPNVDHKNAKTVVAKVEKAVMKGLQEMNSPVTLSMGVVTFQAAPLTAEDLLYKADALMYQAKLMGKNQTIYFEIK